MKKKVSRRSFVKIASLAGAGVAGVAASSPANLLAVTAHQKQATSPASTDKPYRIDVHHHILPPVYVDALKSIGQNRSGGVELPARSNALAAVQHPAGRYSRPASENLGTMR